MDPLIVYTTYPNKKIGEEVAEEIIRKNHATCANIIEKVTTLYAWKGKIQREKEVIIVYKTDRDRYKSLETALKKSHPYDCPCILALKIEEGEKNFLAWLSGNKLN